MLFATLIAGYVWWTMVDVVTTAEVEDVLSSIRRLVGETKRPEQKKIQADTKNMLVLTQHLRVPDDRDVLRLEPEQAIPDEPEIDRHEEPPLEVVAETSDAPLKLSEEVRLPTIEVNRTSDAEFRDLSAKIAALETAIARTADQWEPDGEGRDAYAGTQAPAMEWREDVEFDGTGRPVTPGMAEDQTRVAEPELTSAEDHLEAALEEQVIDEDTLREMVAEIVRAELKGELGVRITRNVRTLVRREIHRALIAQKLS